MKTKNAFKYQVQYRGQTMTIKELSLATGINVGTLYARHAKGWQMPELINAPPNATNKRDTPTANSYYSMIQRCHNPKNPNYQYYGAKGVVVCQRWLGSYDLFIEDMGERPDGLTLDRIDPTGDYSPDNCQWATDVEQAYNRRETVKEVVRGETLTLAEITDKYDLTLKAVRRRYQRGLRGEQLIKRTDTQTYTVLGFTGTQAQICRRFGVKTNSLCNWLKKSVEHAEQKILIHGTCINLVEYQA